MGFFEAFLARRGAIAPEDIVEALDAARQERPRIGQLALQRRLLSVSEVCDVLDRQLDVKLPFGAIAVDFGYLTGRQLAGLLELQRRIGPVSSDVLLGRGLIDDSRLSELHEDYEDELSCEYAGSADDTGATELLASQGLSLALAHAQCVRPFSKVVLKILALLDQPDCDLNEIGRLSEADPSLAAQLMKLAASAWYSRGRPVRDVRQAVNCVGARRLREVVLASTFFGLFDRTDRQADGVRTHSAGSAAIAHELARWVEAPNPGAVTLGALMHDVGKLLLIQSSEFDYRTLGAEESEFPTTAHLIERMRLGYDHAVLGEMALRLWNYPSELASVVGMHHYFRPPAAADTETRITLGLIALSDLVDHGVATRQPTTVATLRNVIERFGLNLDPDQVSRRWMELEQARAQALALFA